MSVDLRGLIRSERVIDKMTAGSELAKLPATEALPILDELASDSSPDLRILAIKEMGKLFPDRARSLAKEFILDSDVSVRCCAAYMLGKLGVIDSVRIVEMMLQNDPVPLVRYWAATALGQIGDDASVPLLRQTVASDQGVDDQGTPIREIAEQAIGKIIARSSVS